MAIISTVFDGLCPAAGKKNEESSGRCAQVDTAGVRPGGNVVVPGLLQRQCVQRRPGDGQQFGRRERAVEIYGVDDSIRRGRCIENFAPLVEPARSNQMKNKHNSSAMNNHNSFVILIIILLLL